METLPVFLDRLLNPLAAVLLSVTAILLFGASGTRRRCRGAERDPAADSQCVGPCAVDA